MFSCFSMATLYEGRVADLAIVCCGVIQSYDLWLWGELIIVAFSLKNLRVKNKQHQLVGLNRLICFFLLLKTPLDPEIYSKKLIFNFFSNNSFSALIRRFLDNENPILHHYY